MISFLFALFALICIFILFGDMGTDIRDEFNHDDYFNNFFKEK